jgi:putative FmdB family regulatory protein
MPTYEYECDLCHCRFDKRQGFDEKPIAACPRCEGEAHRVFHAVPILFKGSGFYITDHGRGSAGTRGRERDERAEKEPAKEATESATAKEVPKKDDNGSHPGETKEQPRSSTADKK